MGRLPRNDLAQYDALAGQWWDASGEFAALHWLAASRAEHIPPAPRPEAVLLGPPRLLAAADDLGLDLRLVGLRPSFREALAWRLGWRDTVRMRPVRSTAVLFAGYGGRR